MPEDLTGQDTLLQPARVGRDARGPGPPSAASHRSNASYITAASTRGPGSFNADPKATVVSRSDLSKPDLDTLANWPLNQRNEKEFQMASETRQKECRDRINREVKIRTGTENLLEAYSKNPTQHREQRIAAERELEGSNRKIAQLRHELAEEIEKAKEIPPPMPTRLSQLFNHEASPSLYSRPTHETEETEGEDETESPTYALADLLQALEREGMGPGYYVERANSLVELLRRHPGLKFDLVWDIFGRRAQTMLLSDSREVVASGFRVMRYAISDLKSLRIMRSFHTDNMVILSLVKDGKVSVEREQALKFVRAFLDLEGGYREVSRPIVRTIVSVAESHEDRMRNICLLTLAELMVLDPELANAAGAMGIISNTLGEGMYHPSESIAGVLTYLLDSPTGRTHLKSGHELGSALAAFSDANSSEDVLRSSAKFVAALLKTWSGLMALCMNDFISLRSLSTSLYISSSTTCDMILELILDVLRIKPPSWSSSFLAGRRLTTYGRVANIKPLDSDKAKEEASGEKQELVEHFVALILAALLKSGLLGALEFTIKKEPHPQVKRKATLLLSEILNMAATILPQGWAADMHVLPDLFHLASTLHDDGRHVATSTIYQIDSVNRTLHRTGQKPFSHGFELTAEALLYASIRSTPELSRLQFTPQVDDATFRQALVETGVITHHNFMKWKWDLIEKVVEGPLLNPKRLDEAARTSKFMKRLTGFYRPFKYSFSDIRNTKPNQRYVRVGCALMKTLLSHQEGYKYLSDNKILPQIAECLAQVDRMSGLTSSAPLFSSSRVQDTLSHGYFALLGAMSSSARGLEIFGRWKMANMFYHIIELDDRDDLIKALLGSLDYTLEGVLRVILSKALTSCSTEVRIFATRLLRKYAVGSSANMDTACVEWAIDLLISQLYDTEVPVCETATTILQEACHSAAALEYVVQCRPMLDHLGEAGAPLLLRFLSTSIGYHYLDDLDYITQEMDDWCHGRNDVYVTQVEASLAQAMTSFDRNQAKAEDHHDPSPTTQGQAPPHFYRELARTQEGCRLLDSKGHFDDFVAYLERHGLEAQDAEIMLKVKGCLWAVGNVGSMDLGTPFLESTNVIALVVRIAEESAVMSLRGTATFVLGLISRSMHGQEVLAQHGWEVAVDRTGTSTGICLPRDFGRVFGFQQWPAAGRGRDGVADNLRFREEVKDGDAQNQRILELVNDLSNTVLSKTRAAELQKIKARKADGFSDPALFYKVMSILDRHHFRLPVLRFVMDLFDKDVMRKIMLDESDTDEFDTTLRPGHGGG